MIHEIVPVGPLQCNCSILGDETTREAIVVDPGDEIDEILAILARHGLRLKYIVITHAHIDHTGYLPRLRKQGFDGPVFCTPSTAELLGLLLPDCGHLQEEDAKFAAKKGFSKHHPPLPLYTADDAREVLRLLQPVEFDERVALADGLAFRYRP